MNYLEKYNKIIAELEKTNYSAFSGRKEDALFILNMRLDSLINYFTSIYKYNINNQQLKLLYSDDEYKYEYEKMDKKRHDLHDQAMLSLKALNELCKSLGMEKFTDIDVENRKEVGREIGKIVTEIGRY